ncbi:MAG TPA: peptidoglycan-binding protein LysM [bacterium]
MGMFDFLGNVGAKLFGKGKNEAEEIEKLLNKDLPGKIQNLKADFNNGTVTLTGSCDSYATREKAILLAGNVTGVSKVNDRFTSPPKEETTVFYTVKSGDSLSKIAKAIMGDGNKWPKILEANKEVIKNPDLIYPGQQLRIPKS